MTSLRKVARSAAIISACVIGISAPVNAACLISTVTSITPVIANLGTYTAPTTPAVQTISITVQGQYLVTLGGVLGGCSLSTFFQRTTLPAQMTIDGGGSATLPYALRTASSGGSSLIYAGSGIPPEANMLTTTFSPPNVLGSGPYSVTFTVYGQMVPGSLQQGGSYSDGLTFTVVGNVLLLIPTVIATRAFTVVGNVTKTCTIGGVSSPTVDSATIPTKGGIVDSAQIQRTYQSAFCNSPSTLLLTSLNGALTGPASAGGSFQNQINYSASAVFSGANAQLNTATIPSASGSESGLPSAASGTMPQGTITLTITPQVNVLPLVRGSYTDTLRITLTPN